MGDQRACQYLGCEDVAVEYVLVPGETVPNDMFLCRGHAPYVKQALADGAKGGVRVSAGDYGGERSRVWAWRGSDTP